MKQKAGNVPCPDPILYGSILTYKMDQNMTLEAQLWKLSSDCWEDKQMEEELRARVVNPKPTSQ